MSFEYPEAVSDARSGNKVAKEYGRHRKTTLVTGGAGFLGSHLCEALLRRGHRVICVDNLLSGRLGNVDRLIPNSKFSFLLHDVIDPIDVEVGEIYNLASAASPPLYQLNPVHTTKTSVVGSLNMLELAARHGARIFQASTSEVYGDPLVHPQPESYWGHVNSYGPRACYDEGKRCAETLFYDFNHRLSVDVRIARIFNTYGPRMNPEDGRVVSNFVVQALRGQDITIYGDGSQTRSFCYVDDLIEGFLRLMNREEPYPAPVNLGNPGEFTILELAEMVIEMTGSRSRMVFMPLPQDDPRQRRPDITRAGEVLGWTPKIPLAEGLRRTINYFDALLSSPAPEAGRKEYVL
jgi:UDP-glucuronate decarboxylase